VVEYAAVGSKEILHFRFKGLDED